MHTAISGAFFGPVMIIRSIELLQIKFPITASKCIFVCGRVPWLYQYWPGGFMVLVVLCPGTPECSTGSGSGFNVSQKSGQRLKVSSDRLGEAGNQTCNPWFIPYTTAASKLFVAFPWVETSTGPGGFMICVFII